MSVLLLFAAICGCICGECSADWWSDLWDESTPEEKRDSLDGAAEKHDGDSSSEEKPSSLDGAVAVNSDKRTQSEERSNKLTELIRIFHEMVRKRITATSRILSGFF